MICISLLLVCSPPPETSFDMILVPDGFTKQIIASEPLVMDPVSFCFDDQGHILVAESFRQELGVPDNRSSAYWLMDDLASQTIEDRLAMYEKWADQHEEGIDFYTNKQDRIRVLTDRNKDGVFDRVTDFASGFNEPLDGTGAGLFAMDGTRGPSPRFLAIALFTDRLRLICPARRGTNLHGFDRQSVPPTGG